MHEFNADANKVDIHSNNTLKQLLFKFYTKEKSLIFCIQLVGKLSSCALAILSDPIFQVFKDCSHQL